MMPISSLIINHTDTFAFYMHKIFYGGLTRMATLEIS
jgi:hypothetical protein